MMNCAECGSQNTRESIQEEIFPYGVDGPDQILLHANVPVVYCCDCESSFTDYRAEEIRDNVVKKWKNK